MSTEGTAMSSSAPAGAQDDSEGPEIPIEVSTEGDAVAEEDRAAPIEDVVAGLGEVVQLHKPEDPPEDAPSSDTPVSQDADDAQISEAFSETGWDDGSDVIDLQSSEDEAAEPLVEEERIKTRTFSTTLPELSEINEGMPLEDLIKFNEEVRRFQAEVKETIKPILTAIVTEKKRRREAIHQDTVAKRRDAEELEEGLKAKETEVAQTKKRLDEELENERAALKQRWREVANMEANLKSLE